MTTREENKKKLIEKTITRGPFCRVLDTVNFFGWTTRTQIARWLGMSESRIGAILSELHSNAMVRSKEAHLPPFPKYWYLIKKGAEALITKRERDLLLCHITLEEYGELLPISQIKKKRRIPDRPYTHGDYVRRTIITLKDRRYTVLSPRHTFWPERFRKYEAQYKTQPDIYFKKEDDKKWFYPYAVEVECSFKGHDLFPAKLAKHQRMFFNERIPFVYIPTSEAMEKSLLNVFQRLRKEGEYVRRVKGRSRRYGAYDYKVGIVHPLGFFFSNVEMTKLYVTPTDHHALDVEVVECPWDDLAATANQMISFLAHRDAIPGPLEDPSWRSKR